jgi:hypothetical protein
MPDCRFSYRPREKLIQDDHKYDGLNNLYNLETDLKSLNLTRRSRSRRMNNVAYLRHARTVSSKDVPTTTEQ